MFNPSYFLLAQDGEVQDYLEGVGVGGHDYELGYAPV